MWGGRWREWVRVGRKVEGVGEGGEGVLRIFELISMTQIASKQT